jgi:hypothetical protein
MGALGTATRFVSLLAGGSIGIAWSLNNVVNVIVVGASPSNLTQLGLSLGLLTVVVILTLSFLYRLEFLEGSLKRRIRMLEIGC